MGHVQRGFGKGGDGPWKTGRRRRRLLSCGCGRTAVRKLGHHPECDLYRPERARDQKSKQAARRRIEEKEVHR